jgi:hypothetical protein
MQLGLNQAAVNMGAFAHKDIAFEFALWVFWRNLSFI